MRQQVRKQIGGLSQRCRELLRFGGRKTFSLWERLGVHITPVHFYQPIPDTRALGDDIWTGHSSLAGIDINQSAQMHLLEAFSKAYRHEYESFPTTPSAVPYEFHLQNGFLEAVDAEVLYSFIRHFKPRRLIEVGSGYSTFLAAQALRANASVDGSPEAELTSIEPFPNDVLRGGFPGLSRLLRSPVQEIPISEFERLEANDMVFIDSSHVLRIGGDVQFEYLEVLPRLKPGVLVHVHDIFLPAEYPKDWVLGRRRFWNEQYLLQAWLAFNDRFEVLWAGSYLHLQHPELLQQAFPSYDPTTTWPASFWMRRKPTSTR